MIERTVKTGFGAREPDFYEDLSDWEIEIVKAQCSKTLAALSKGKSLAGVIEVARKTADSADRLLEKILAKNRVALVCKIGCDYCCYLPVDATPPGVLRVAAFLRSQMDGAALSHMARRFSDSGPKPYTLDQDERAGFLAPCILLRDRQCLAYGARPLSCRGYNSIDVELCRSVVEGHRTERGDPSKIAQWRVVFHLGKVMELINLGMLAGLYRVGYAPARLDFSAALLISLKDPDAAEKWLEREEVFSGAQIRGGPEPGPRFWSRFMPEEGGPS